MARLYVNNYTSTLASAITNSDTGLTVTSATGLPTITGSDYYYLTLATGGTIEIVKVTARTGTALTVTRAQESTSAVAWAAGSVISLRPTAESFSEGVFGPGTTTDNAIARWDGTDGVTLQDSSVTIDDSDVVSGATQLNVDNLRLDGNTISSTNTNGDINITPDGTGDVIITKDVKIQADSTPIYLGAGDDATIQYNGTNLQINPQAVGSGVVDITAGDLYISGSGKGISFDSGTNVLDYYEVGTFTPAFTFQTVGDLSVAYSAQTGEYERIGDLCFIYINLICTPTFTTSSGKMRVTGLPFTAKRVMGGTLGTSDADLSFGTGITQINPSVFNNQTFVEYATLGSSTDGGSITTSEVTSGNQLTLRFTIPYIVQ